MLAQHPHIDGLRSGERCLLSPLSLGSCWSYQSSFLFIFAQGALAFCFYLSFAGAAAVDAENGVQGKTKGSKSGVKSIGQQTGLLWRCSSSSRCSWM